MFYFITKFNLIKLAVLLIPFQFILKQSNEIFF